MVSEYDIRQAERPLWLIFWGGLLWLLDVSFSSTSNGVGFRFDLLNDTLATILITVGIARLARVPVGGNYQTIMRFVYGVAIASIVETALNHFVFPMPVALGILLSILGLLQLAATLGFCIAMRDFCLEGGLRRSAESWRLTLILMVCIYAIPLGLFRLVDLGARIAGTSINIDAGLWVLSLMLVLLVPLVHLFLSIHRTRRDAATGGAYPGRGFPVVPLPIDPASQHHL